MTKKWIPVLLALGITTLTACSSHAGKPANTGSKSSAPSSSVSQASSASPQSSSAPASSSSSQSAPVKKPVHESTDKQVISLYTQAANAYTAKDYTSAVNDCNKALAIDPLCYEAINIKGAAQYYATGDPQQGFPLLEKCLSINPNYMYAYFNEALIYKGEKNWDKSIALFDKAISLSPNYAWSYYGISTIYADRNMVPQSLQYLKMAIDRDPSVKATARVQDHYDRMRSNPDFQALVK